MSGTKGYAKKIFYSEEDGGFIAVAPDLPGCSAFGETEAEALSELSHAMEAWLQAMRAAGNPIPLPSKEVEPDLSGRVLLRIPKSLHGRLAYRARTEGVSLNQYMVALLSGAYMSHSFECFYERRAYTVEGPIYASSTNYRQIVLGASTSFSPTPKYSERNYV
ncbi:type II toxin-antitoxin system HicB family antitoxin [Prosthecomicrobium sp. N25]|uniref:type II toxin-antitoxin system HicB family antitoxin n=1 Tax=Prosthecomicrobium sp. N25 TaxID=3129254 RepID=UPI003076E030